MKAGALYCGTNALSGNLIMVDRLMQKNPNGLILGTPGCGKSFTAKREMIAVYLLTNDDIIVCDPEAEYWPLVKRLHGQVIKDFADLEAVRQSHGFEPGLLRRRQPAESKGGLYPLLLRHRRRLKRGAEASGKDHHRPLRPHGLPGLPRRPAARRICLFSKTSTTV